MPSLEASNYFVSGTERTLLCNFIPNFILNCHFPPNLSIARVSDEMLKQESCPVNEHIFLKGIFLVRCKVLSSQLTVSEQSL